MKILPRLTDTDSMKNAILQYQKSLKAEFGDLIQKDIGALKAIPDQGDDAPVSEEDLKKLAELSNDYQSTLKYKMHLPTGNPIQDLLDKIDQELR